MFEISVSGGFVAAHQLREPGGELEPLHKHQWRVKVTYAGPELSESGMLVDFGRIRTRLGELLADLDHQNLNRLPAFIERVPSAENVARHLGERLPNEEGPTARLWRVEVEEEPGCTASYLPPRE